MRELRWSCVIPCKYIWKFQFCISYILFYLKCILLWYSAYMLFLFVYMYMSDTHTHTHTHTHTQTHTHMHTHTHTHTHTTHTLWLKANK